MSSNSKYPEIVIDKDTNLINPNGFFNLTFEQFYDLMHHTHAAEDIVGESEQQESLNSLTQAVILAKSNSKRGQVVLFSPASTSFDMFKNMYERGDKFKELIGGM